MKRKLGFEMLEARDVPAAGSTLSVLAVSPDYTLSVNSTGRVAVIELSNGEWVDYRDGNQSPASMQAMTQFLYQHFPDNFDQILMVNNLPDITTGLFGFNIGTQNQTLGTGTAVFDDTALWGSDGKLQNVIWVGSELDMYRRTILHEFLHKDAAFLPQLQSSDPAHWGFSSVGGQLGGWAPGTLRQIGPNEYDADSPAGFTDWYENSPAFPDDGFVPYAELELYLMGLIDATQVSPIQYAINGAFTNQPLGHFSADSIQTLTMNNIIAQEGLRLPTPLNSQKSFSILPVIITPNPLTQAELDQFDTNVELMSRAGSDGDPTVLNFWEATGGRGSWVMGGLNDYLPPRSQFLAVGAAGKGSGLAVGSSGKFDTLVAPNIAAYFGVSSESLRMAVGDVDGDSIPDFAISTGPGSATRFGVLSGDQTRFIIPPSAAFLGSEDFTGGAFVSVGDLDGDGRSDVVVSADNGGGPRVTVYSHKPNVGTYRLVDFLGIADASFRGGARTAVGDVNGDGRADLAVAAGPGGGPRIAIYNGASLFTSRGKIVGDFFAFPGADAVNLRNGVYLAVGDVNADGFGDLVFGAGTGGSPRVIAMSGRTLITNGSFIAGSAPLADFYAGSTSDRGGVRVAVKNVDGDARMDIVTGSGVGVAGTINVYKGATLRGRAQPPLFQSLSVFTTEAFTDGIYVG